MYKNNYIIWLCDLKLDLKNFYTVYIAIVFSIKKNLDKNI